MQAGRGQIFVAIDTADFARARHLATSASALADGLKLGLEFFCAHGPQGIRALKEEVGLPLFLDLKLHDIPNTVAGALRALLALAPAYMTLHCLGGGAMLRQGRDAMLSACAALGIAPPKLLGVTLLTSHDAQDLPILGITNSVSEEVLQLGSLAREAGLDGLVCSGHELHPLRQAMGQGMILAVPGIRATETADDQRRTLDAGEARRRGADILVVGRAVTQAEDVSAALRALKSGMA
ncbi:MAG TPA: orotidine-5'-phosphate decarboxylase [Dongiaceae bacterium]|jgi:orotidine-5'-phosphate decarboxylase|nr:orotidine-5'-phosphate decarboxylase [Dongiaceae bacterium]